MCELIVGEVRRRKGSIDTLYVILCAHVCVHARACVRARARAFGRGVGLGMVWACCAWQVARAFGTLLRQGWRPRRTIVLCSWDGEEYGLLGSTAWGETRAAHLSAAAVAYLNVDVGVSGRSLSVHLSGMLAPVVRGAIASLTDPDSGLPLAQVWDGTIGDLGSGGAPILPLPPTRNPLQVFPLRL